MTIGPQMEERISARKNLSRFVTVITSLPSLISDVSDDEDLEEDGYILLNHDNLNNRLSF